MKDVLTPIGIILGLALFGAVVGLYLLHSILDPGAYLG